MNRKKEITSLTELDLEKSIIDLKLFSNSCQAEIYSYGENKVLRILKNPQDKHKFKKEIETMRALNSTDVDVPKIYEAFNFKGRPAVVLEKIYGNTMLTDLRRHPIRVFKKAKLLANLHLSLSKNGSIKNLVSAKSRAHYLISRADILKLQSRKFVFGLLDELAEGSELCHGDFHPGNIIQTDNKKLIIDWFGAYKGDILSDVANTYLVLKGFPRFSAKYPIRSTFIKLLGSLLAKKYLSAFRKQRTFEWLEFSKWLVIKAAERISCGLPFEKSKLITFIENCERSNKHPESWCRKINSCKLLKNNNN